MSILQYKLYVENMEKQVSKCWNNDYEIVQDYINRFNKITSTLYEDLEYCQLNCHDLNTCCEISYDSFQICEIDESGSLTFLSLDEVNQRIHKVKVLIDDSYMADKTRSKDYILKVLDYETGTKVICEKLHMSNLFYMLTGEEVQEFTDGKRVFTLPLKLLKDFDSKVEGYANPYSDYNMRKKGYK